MTNRISRRWHRQGCSQLNPVSNTGARGGSVLRGLVLHNHGLRLRVLQDQCKGQEGPLRGHFEILDVGDNKHATSLLQFVGATTDAQEIITVLRLTSPACVNVVNANILTVEGGPS
jgi:hypothetical protein